MQREQTPVTPDDAMPAKLQITTDNDEEEWQRLISAGEERLTQVSFPYFQSSSMLNVMPCATAARQASQYWQQKRSREELPIFKSMLRQP